MALSGQERLETICGIRSRLRFENEKIAVLYIEIFPSFISTTSSEWLKFNPQLELTGFKKTLGFFSRNRNIFFEIKILFFQKFIYNFIENIFWHI